MAGYTKLFSSIITSTVWCEDNATLRVWIAMLAMKDRDGVVEGSVPGFAHVSRVSVDEMREAIRILSSPDPDSRNPRNEGRRIEIVEGGWVVLNHDSYCEKESQEHRREKTNERQRRWKERHSHKKENHKGSDDLEKRVGVADELVLTPTNALTPEITPTNAHSPHAYVYAYTDTDTDTDTNKSKDNKGAKFAPPTPSEVSKYIQENGFSVDPEKFWNFYEASGWVRKGGVKIKNWKAAVMTWVKSDFQNNQKGGQNGKPQNGFRNHDGDAGKVADPNAVIL